MTAHEVLFESVPSKRLFRVAEAARYLGISDDSLRKYADLGEIPVYCFHRRRAFKLEDLNQLIGNLPLWNDDDHGETRAGRERETP